MYLLVHFSFKEESALGFWVAKYKTNYLLGDSWVILSTSKAFTIFVTKEMKLFQPLTLLSLLTRPQDILGDSNTEKYINGKFWLSQNTTNQQFEFYRNYYQNEPRVTMVD